MKFFSNSIRDLRSHEENCSQVHEPVWGSIVLSLNSRTAIIRNTVRIIDCTFILSFQTELRAEERLAEEQKRHRELLARVEREAKLQNENCQIRIRTIEVEANQLREEISRLRLQCDKQAADLHATEDKLEKTRDNLMIAQQELAEAKANEKKYLALSTHENDYINRNSKF